MHSGASVVTLISEHRQTFPGDFRGREPGFSYGAEGSETTAGDTAEDRKLWTGIPTWISNGDATAARLLRPSSWHVLPKTKCIRRPAGESGSVSPRFA